MKRARIVSNGLRPNFTTPHEAESGRDRRAIVALEDFRPNRGTSRVVSKASRCSRVTRPLGFRAVCGSVGAR